jgi:transposase-like protein
LGIGDFLIWKTILEIGAKNKKHIIFVSADEKADWQHRSGGSGFLPRYELVDEFRRASTGKSFFILPLSKLLELLKVEEASVEEIKKEEVRIKVANTVTVDCPNCDSNLQWHLAEHVGASAAPFCPDCGENFHIHRTRDGVTIHRAYERANRETESEETIIEKIACPKCKNEIESKLGTYHKATNWCRCVKCEYLFPIHRKSDGSIMISTPRRSDIG